MLGQTMYFGLNWDNMPNTVASHCSCHGYLDTSKIASINITISIQYCIVQIFGIGFNKSGTFQNDISSNSINSMILMYTDEDKPSYSSAYTNFTINSFTTTDGKVHTADNLNY